MKKFLFIFIFIFSFQAQTNSFVDNIIANNKEELNTCNQNSTEQADCHMDIILKYTTLDELYKSYEDHYQKNNEEFQKLAVAERIYKTEAGPSIKPGKSKTDLTKPVREYYKKNNSKKCLAYKDQLSIQHDPWSNNNLKLRLEKILAYSKKFLLTYHIDPYIMSCLSMRESKLIPSALNYTYCQRKNTSSAIGLTMITGNTLKDLYEKHNFRSAIPRYKKIKNYKVIHERLTQDPELQVEIGMAILYKIKASNGEKKTLKDNQRKFLHSFTKKQYRQYVRILFKYVGYKCNLKNTRYAIKILGCAQCLKAKTTNTKACLNGVFDTKKEVNKIRQNC